MKPFTLKAFAKINPVLKVGSLRPDGYHEIDSILQLVTLHDTVSFEPAQELTLTCSVSALSGNANIAWKSLRLLSELVDLPPVQITIKKRIPIEAGLGGGSSDCAAVLLGIQSLLGSALPESEVHAIGAACGSDVPFFLMQTPRARVTGRGDLVEVVLAIARQYLVIAKPEIGVSTAEAYAALDKSSRNDAPQGDLNDFERVAPCECLELIERMQILGASEAHLCGSGSAVYGVVPTKEMGEVIAAKLGADGYWSETAHTLEGNVG